jgi:cytochrome b
VKRTLVWDVPTRLFHWLLVACFAGAWLTSTSDRWLSIHVFLGYVMLGLIGFRLVWGWVGGTYARFASFVVGPKAGFAYLRALAAGHDAPSTGHNPAAGQAIVLMLLLGLVVGATGIFAQGSEERQGAVTGLMSVGTGTLLRQVHEVLAILMLVVVGGHLTGVALGSWLHGENLPLSMLTGMKRAPDGTPASGAFRGVAAALALVVASFGAWWFFYAWHEPVKASLGQADATQNGPHVAFVGRTLPDDPLWREECGSCHLAFHPNLLPSRSWQRLIAEQGRHFGTDLALDAATADAVLAFLVRNAAENSPTEAAFKISRSIPKDVTPLRITETPYWVVKHGDIRDADWRSPQVKSRTACAACHLDAEAGTFEDAAMRIPRQAAVQGAPSSPP